MERLTWHSDPGHAWLQVPIAEVRSLGIEVTPFSYMDRNGYAYLEEDVDASTYIRAIGESAYHDRTTATDGYTVAPDVYTDGDSPVRRMRPYRT